MKTFDAITQFGKMLRNLDNCIVKAEAHATAKKFEVNLLTGERLAPDMYPFVKQVQACCDSAKFTAAYLSGSEPPKHPDTETTIAECRARIKLCLTYLETLTEASFEGAEDRKVAPAWLQGKWVKGDQYLLQLALPNFYFHVTTAYAILRYNGVDVGKMDFIGNLPLQG
jgi:hypothetical protein